MITPKIIDLRPFLPSRDFEVSKAFYGALGFELTWEGDGLAIFQSEGAQFFVQNYYHEGWAKNCMMNLVVADVAAWARHIQAAGILDRFEGVKVSDAKSGPHGTILYLTDPAGVLWHIQQRPEA
ncbi:MAG: Glyoxalase/bleomycin resistance protein/dioxygenase [Rariglobus sp.]|jgi:hypothetical protein|nr:Glyoxalase/bleomycin resistance protein/dioxygenase [Rariglobus sp.]